MGQTLENSIYLPDEGETNCYSGLASNWRALDTLKGNYSLHAINVDIHVTAAEKETWNSKADSSALTAHTGDTTIHVTAADKQAWNGHVADTTIHVTSADKQAWNGKADASSLTAHTGDTTIHVTAADKQTWDTVTSKADSSALTAHTGDTTIHVTAADKTNWNGKANDTDAVHKSGAETIAGVKTFSDTVTVPSINGINPGALSLPDISAGVDISGYITTGSTTQTYTPPANGWISLGCASSAQNAIYVWDVTNGWGSSSRSVSNDTYNTLSALAIPVLAGTPITIELRGVTTLAWAKFYPCKGNV